MRCHCDITVCLQNDLTVILSVTPLWSHHDVTFLTGMLHVHVQYRIFIVSNIHVLIWTCWLIYSPFFPSFILSRLRNDYQIWQLFREMRHSGQDLPLKGSWNHWRYGAIPTVLGITKWRCTGNKVMLKCPKKNQNQNQVLYLIWYSIRWTTHQVCRSTTKVWYGTI